MNHCSGLFVVVAAVVVVAAAAAAVVVAFAVQALVSISSLEGFLNSHWKCSFVVVVLLSVSAVQLLVAAAGAATDPAQCTGSKDLTRQFVRQSPD